MGKHDNLVRPSLEEVAKATPKQLLTWYRFLDSPVLPEDSRVSSAIHLRLQTEQLQTEELSNEVGWPWEEE